MKKLALIAIAAGAATLAPQTASAQVVIHPGFGGGFHPGFGHRFSGAGNFFGGFAFGGFFHQPQFHVQNWQLYGFINPGHDRRWIRHFDDAYLIDRRGYIFDRRHGVAWDRYGERWAHDQHGVPYYAGRGDYHPDERDYEEAEYEGRYGSGRYGGGYGASCGGPQPCGGAAYGSGYGHSGYGHSGYGHSGYGHSGHVVRHVAPACGHPGHACGGSGAYSHGGYATGYGYGHGGTVIVTETTITPGTVVTEEIIEEVVEHRPARRHVRHVKPRRHKAPPPPRVIYPRGDRG